MTLNLFTFNNYYNRVNKRFETIEEYEGAGVLLYSYSDRNFNPNDGVSTSFIFNYNGAQPDYCVVTNEYNEIVSRWFVIEAVRTRGGQYSVNLLRDLVSDYYTAVLNNPCFIEKATIKDIDSPLIFNKENMSYNQVRTEQTFLYDKSKCPWIVGYLPEDEGIGQVDATITSYAKADETVNGIENWEYYSLVDKANLAILDAASLEYRIRYIADKGFSLLTGHNIKVSTPVDVKYTPRSNNVSDYRFGMIYDPEEYELESFSVSEINENNARLLEIPIYGATPNAEGGAVATIDETLKAILTCMDKLDKKFTWFNNSAITNLEANGKVVTTHGIIDSIKGTILHDSTTDIFYKVKVSKSTEVARILAPADICDRLSRIMAQYTGSDWYPSPYPDNFDWWTFWPTLHQDFLTLEYGFTKPVVELEIVSIGVQTAGNITETINLLPDAPYKMICIPYGKIECRYGDQAVEKFTTDPAAGYALAAALMTSSGTRNVFDLQLLPYCPIPGAIVDGVLDARRVTNTLIIEKRNNTPVNIVCGGVTSSFTFTIPANIPKGSTVLERKINTETVMYRLCSPNGAGQFELDAEMNGGVSGWEVNCTYKPFQPFIQIKPIFGGLYGIETDTDYRGLICGGDFSMPQLSDAWADYQLNNKTYQEQFDREIQNLKVNQKGARWKEAIGAVSSIIGGSVATGVSGSPLAGANLFTGAITSGANLAINDRLREETLDYRQDQFGFELANIQAIPQSITKTAANVINNPLVPYVEKYECTEIEKQALIEKLKYNGMTVGIIGKIVNYITPNKPTYIKGKMIRVEGIQDDYHIAEALAAEINKGVFL